MDHNLNVPVYYGREPERNRNLGGGYRPANNNGLGIICTFTSEFKKLQTYLVSIKFLTPE